MLGLETDRGKIESVLIVYPVGSNIQRVITLGMNTQVELSLAEWCKDFFGLPLIRVEGKKPDHSVTEVLIQGDILFVRREKSLLCGKDFFDKKAVSPHVTQEQTILISPHHVQGF